MTALKQVPVTRDDLGYEPKHRAQPTRELSPLVDPPTLAGHVDGHCPRCQPEWYAVNYARHRAWVA